MVNIKNYSNEEKVKVADFLRVLFEKQTSLVNKYRDIEIIGNKKMNEYLEGTKLRTINTLESQELCKNFSWRVIEEIAEGLDALEHNDRTHLKEELADGLHFLTELMILNGFESKDFQIDTILFSMEEILDTTKTGSEFSVHPTYVTKMIHSIGMAMNRLKMKNWKVSQVLVDVPRYKEFLKIAFYHYFELVASMGFTLDELSEGYVAKNEVNKFRIKTNY